MFVRGIPLTILLLAVAVRPLNSSPCQTYGCTKSTFLPAPPGRTPSCAKHGETFCEQIENYPTKVIEYLIEHWQYDYNSVFVNERRETKPRPVYGPPSYPYPPKSKFPSHYGGVPQEHLRPPPSHDYNGIFRLRYNQSDEGYPERNYQLPPAALQVVSDDPGFLYSAIIRPELATPPVSPYDPNKWWRRYTRIARRKRNSSNETYVEGNDKRQKRQAGVIGATTLCPTTPRFIQPRAALNSNGNWMYVVNLDTDEKYMQLVRSETCISSQCNGICSLPQGYTSKCQQQFVQKRLTALGGGGDSLYTDLFWLPHCCICQITPTNL